MAFPNNPSNNDTHTIGNKTFRWDGSVWRFQLQTNQRFLAWANVDISGGIVPTSYDNFNIDAITINTTDNDVEFEFTNDLADDAHDVFTKLTITEQTTSSITFTIPSNGRILFGVLE